jgi:hypothetical protein
MKVSELTGAALDWAVAKAEGVDGYIVNESFMTRWTDDECEDGVDYHYSTDWAQGGPIIERCCINVYYDGGNGYWCATTDSGDPPRFGPTPLIAAMRCYVASQMGAEIELPEELK